MSQSSPKLPSLEEVRKELAERSLSDYTRQAWPIIEPGRQYLHNWHIDAISEHLEAVTAGQILRLIINLPPRNMKSIEVSVMWPTWVWIKQPEKRFLAGSYSQSLSTKHNVDRRTIIRAPWYQQRWGDVVQISDDQDQKTEFTNSKRGHMIATSVDGTAIGKGGDFLIVDDPVNPKEASSDALRTAANTWFDQTFYTRLDDKKRGAIVVVMQRLHEMDLTGHILAKGDKEWVTLSLPAEAEERQVIIFPMSGRQIAREPGDILWPEREGPKELAQTRKALGSYGYAGQYQQNPSPAGGGILKRHWWRYWRPAGVHLPPVTVKDDEGRITLIDAVELPTAFLTEQIQSWDMSFKDTEDSAYVVGQVWARHMADKYLLDQIRDKMDFVRTEQALRTLTAKWPRAAAKLVEDKANGPAIISRLQRKIPGLLAVDPEGDKVARARAISPQVESGNVYLPHPMIAPWVEDFLGETDKFPNSAYKDQVDAATQALSRLDAGVDPYDDYEADPDYRG